MRMLHLLLAMALTSLPCAAAKRHFTVADDIGFEQFIGNPYAGPGDPVRFSPDGEYFVVQTERGRLDLNRPESTLRLFRTGDVRQFLLSPKVTREPPPIWIVSKSSYPDGPIITHVRWLADSSGVAFLAKSASGNDQLFLAELATQTVSGLTPADQDVKAFDIRDRTHAVYAVQSPSIREKINAETQADSIVGTGRSFDSLMFPIEMLKWYDRSELWAIVDGTRLRVEDKLTHRPLTLYSAGQRALAMSPDGHSVVTALAVDIVPAEWEAAYPPPRPSYPYRIKAGRQDLQAFAGSLYVSSYVLVDLVSGKGRPLTNAPMGSAIGIWDFARADWSRDGHSVVLPDTFLPLHNPTSENQPNRPCVAVADLAKGELTCVERLKAIGDGPETNIHFIQSVHFDGVAGEALTLDFLLANDSRGSTRYVRLDDGSWRVRNTQGSAIARPGRISVVVNEGLNDPPVLVATDDETKSSRVIWDPNPQFKDIEFSEASVFQWKDKAGRDRIAGLYRPRDFIKGRRYPLVIQTHGFSKDHFLPSGLFPTAFAAQELAAAGILVLQVQDCIDSQTTQEAACQLAGYEAAVETLVAGGLVDPERVGIIGFSRTCYYVMEALTNSTLHFRAASITDGVNEGYLQYITKVDSFGNWIAHEAEAVNGSRPFGEGLQQWLKRSPEFNMDKVVTPLQVVVLGRSNLIFMWEPYAALRYLNKPVELIMLNGGTHVLTNPAHRMVSQGGTVDWFKFWLKDEEHADPAKAKQYARWRELRKLQGASVKPDASSR